MTIPILWREETLHPLVAHFPIALLTFSTFLYLAFAATKRPFFRSTFLMNLGAGTAAAWLAIYLGEIAEDVVNRVICDPTVTHEHEDFSYYATWSYSFSLTICGFQFFSQNFRRPLVEFFLFLSLIAGVALLSYAGHLGASLVYEQGAAVHHPSPECTEFE